MIETKLNKVLAGRFLAYEKGVPKVKFDSTKGRFIRADGTEIEGIAVTKNRGRWQYRIDHAKGRVIASGMTPDVFAKEFWFAKEIEVI